MSTIPDASAKPSWGTFLHSRIFSANGAAAVLYLALSIWIYKNPERAAKIWRRLEGR